MEVKAKCRVFDTNKKFIKKNDVLKVETSFEHFVELINQKSNRIYLVTIKQFELFFEEMKV